MPFLWQEILLPFYTSIPPEGENGGFQAFEKYLEQRPNKEVPTQFLMDLLRQVMTNIFEFNDQLWVQKIGTAMGTMVAPSYANIFMAWLEEELILKTWKGTKPKLYYRFLDDIIFLWDSSVEELEEFIDHMNSCHPYIKFEATFDQETKTIPFLDMEIPIQDGKLSTDL